MQTHNIIYKNNKFYDTTTNTRIYPKDGARFLLAGDNQDFLDRDPLNEEPHKSLLLSSENKEAQVKEIKNLEKYKLFLKKGEKLYFEFNLTKRKSENEAEHYRFWLELSEDLYLHTCKNWKADALPELHACHCVVRDEVTENLEFFERIYAKSLNEAISKTRQFYFPNQGTPGASAYLMFKNEARITLDDMRKPLLDFFKR